MLDILLKVNNSGFTIWEKLIVVACAAVQLYAGMTAMESAGKQGVTTDTMRSIAARDASIGVALVVALILNKADAGIVALVGFAARCGFDTIFDGLKGFPALAGVGMLNIFMCAVSFISALNIAHREYVPPPAAGGH